MRLFFDKESRYGYSINTRNLAVRTAKATSVSRRSVHRVQKEHLACDGEILTPIMRYTMSRIRLNPDSFDCDVIRKIVHSFYERKEYPTLCKLLDVVKSSINFPGGRFCLWRVLHSLGFGYKKRDDKQFIYEQRNILEKGHANLQQIQTLRKENKYQLIYTDETWVNAHHNDEYIWVDKDGKGGWKVPSGKGQRLIVLHAGGVNGWVEGADLVFTSKMNSTDYHDEMNSEHYIEWLNDILPTLDKPSVIILDNASYHNKQKDRAPTSNDTKAIIQNWLDTHNIPYNTTDIKKTLLDIVKIN